MKIHFSAPRGVGPTDDGGDWHLDMPAVPCVGDTVYLSEYAYRVHAVVWYPYGDKDSDQLDPFVYIVLR